MANKLLPLGALLPFLAVCAFAQTATTDPVGFVRIPELAASDTIVSPPLERTPEFRGEVASITNNIISVRGAPAWAANQFLYSETTQPKTYYLRFIAGARAGAYYTILGNTANTLTIDLNGDTLSAVAAGDKLQLTPYWTLGTIFPSTDAGISFEQTTSPLDRKTEIFFPNQSLIGINPSSGSSFFYYKSAWRKFGENINISYNDKGIILPDAYIIVRNKSISGSITIIGAVLTSPAEIGLNSYKSQKQDNVVSTTRPIDISLNNSGLISSNAFTATTNPINHKDEVFVYDSTGQGYNRSPTATYYYYNNAWRKFGENVNYDAGNELAFKAGAGAVIRKAANGNSPTTTNWKSIPTY